VLEWTGCEDICAFHVHNLNVPLGEQPREIKGVDGVRSGQLCKTHFVDWTGNDWPQEPSPPQSTCALGKTRKAFGVSTKALRAKTRECPPDHRKRELLSSQVKNVVNVLAQGVRFDPL
jgi:hypothetical protein